MEKMWLTPTFPLKPLKLIQNMYINMAAMFASEIELTLVKGDLINFYQNNPYKRELASLNINHVTKLILNDIYY